MLRMTRTREWLRDHRMDFLLGIGGGTIVTAVIALSEMPVVA